MNDYQKGCQNYLLIRIDDFRFMISGLKSPVLIIYS